MVKSRIRFITDQAIIAGVYVALTLAFSQFSYLGVQFRFGEILVLLPFFRKDYAFGLVLGCAIANLFSPLGYIDVIFGTLATLLSVVAIAYSKKLWLATIFPVVFNAIIVGLELHFVLGLPFWLSAGQVALGQFVVISLIGYAVFMNLRKNKRFLEVVRANQNVTMSY